MIPVIQKTTIKYCGYGIFKFTFCFKDKTIVSTPLWLDVPANHRQQLQGMKRRLKS